MVGVIISLRGNKRSRLNIESSAVIVARYKSFGWNCDEQDGLVALSSLNSMGFNLKHRGAIEI